MESGFDYQNTFGPPSSCLCEDCASIYSPGAYLADLLFFLRSPMPGQPDQPSSSDERAQLFGPIQGHDNKPIVRRPDLALIQLSCINTETPMPYIDLVNEILEWAITTDPSVAAPHDWPQTTLSADQLRLAPEHTIDAAYEQLARAALSFSLPLDLASEISRRFLALVGLKRDEVIEAFVPAPSDGTLGPRVAADILGLSAGEYALLSSKMATIAVKAIVSDERALSGLSPGLSAGDAVLVMGQNDPKENGIYLAQPGAWPRAPALSGTVATGVAVDAGAAGGYLLGVLPPVVPGQDPIHFVRGPSQAVSQLERVTGLDVPSLTRLLACRFLSNQLDGTPHTIEMDSTCALAGAKITPPLDAVALERLPRFLRLKLRLGWSFHALDLALRALGAADLDDPTMRALATIERLRRRLNVPILELLSWFGDLDTGADDDGTASLYQRTFQDIAVLAPDTLDALALTPDGSELKDTTKKVADVDAALVGVLRISSAQVAAVLAGGSDALDLANLSKLYRHASLARALGVRVTDLLTLAKVTGLPTFGTKGSGPATTYAFIDAAQFVKLSARPLSDLQGLLRDELGERDKAARDQQVAGILGELGPALEKASGESAATQQTLVVQRLAAALRLDPAIVDVLLRHLPPSGSGGKVAIDDFTDGALASDPSNAPNAIFTLQALLKLATLFGWLNIDASRLGFGADPTTHDPAWLLHHSAEHGWLDLEALPTTKSPAADTFARYRRMAEAFKFWDRFVTSSDSLYKVLTTTTRKGFADALYAGAQTPAWSAADVEFLTGDAGQLGPDDPAGPPSGNLGNGAMLGRVALCISIARLLGVSAANLTSWLDLEPDPDRLAYARKLRQAVKSQFDRFTWAKVAQPVEDALRTLKRDALVSYLIALRGFPDADALYDHFLIDVQMGDCMLTSRIKQAISTVQLFIQRALMNLELPVDIDADRANQWLTWRNSYGLWTANRKVFLYPENWIQASLRVDKTPFFDQVLSAIRQRELTSDAAESILDTYLQQLDAVARLRVVGFWRDDETDTRHVVARTLNTPPIYYYRQILYASDPKAAQYSPWEQIDVDIGADQLLPVLYHRRLHLFWPIFAIKPVADFSSDQTKEGNNRQTEIQLAWTERKGGKWMPKRIATQPVHCPAAAQPTGDMENQPSWSQYQLKGTVQVDVLTITVRYCLLSGTDGYQASTGSFIFQGCGAEPTTLDIKDPSVGSLFDTPEDMFVEFNDYFQPYRGKALSVPDGSAGNQATLLTSAPLLLRILPAHQDLPFAGQTDFFLDDALNGRVFFARNRGLRPPVIAWKGKIDWNLVDTLPRFLGDPVRVVPLATGSVRSIVDDEESVPLVTKTGSTGGES